MRIVEDDLTDPRVHDLLRVHLERMHESSPPGSVFAFDLDGLRAADVTVWTAWDDDAVMGCGALKELDRDHGEVKSMRTADTYLRRGVAAALLERIITAAADRGYVRLSLETGSSGPFEAAHRLYRRRGFVECGPFGRYVDTTFSRYFTLELPLSPARDLADASSPCRERPPNTDCDQTGMGDVQRKQEGAKRPIR